MEVIHGDLEDAGSLGAALDGVRRVYHLAHVRFTANLLQRVSADVEHVVIVSSLRALSRVPSATVGQERGPFPQLLVSKSPTSSSQSFFPVWVSNARSSSFPSKAPMVKSLPSTTEKEE